MNKILRGVVTALGTITGIALYLLIIPNIQVAFLESWLISLFGLIVTAIICGGLFFVLSPWLTNLGRLFANWIINELSVVPAERLVVGSAGLIGGLIIAYLISGLLANIPIPFVAAILSVIVYLFMGYLGVNLAVRAGEFVNFSSISKRLAPRTELTIEKPVSRSNEPAPKILDTSVIIDGRIADICRTGFVEGPLVIPEFVLEELRHIADSSASLKRNRGRRGLDVLSIVQKEMPIEVIITDQDFPDVQEVDVKLLKLAQALSGKVITNDYNLNKVASLQGVDVLNINELANAVKPVVLPGEEMHVDVVKEGKEAGQGLAYLDDGTMIVVENGRRYIGQTIDVLVTSVLQTAAGRMIFAKPKNG